MPRRLRTIREFTSVGGYNEPLRPIGRSGPENENTRRLSYIPRFIEHFFDLFAARNGVFPFYFVAVHRQGLAAVRLGAGGDARTGGVVPSYFGGVHRHGLAAGR